MSMVPLALDVAAGIVEFAADPIGEGPSWLHRRKSRAANHVAKGSPFLLIVRLAASLNFFAQIIRADPVRENSRNSTTRRLRSGGH
jgi:hypothetical protein